MDMAKVGSTTRFSVEIGKHMTLGRAAAGYPLSLTSTMVPEAARCSVFFKVGCPCLPPAHGKGP